MLQRLAVMIVCAGAVASASLATEISEDFSGATNQAWGSGAAGIFNVSANRDTVTGSLRFDPSAFTPNPVAPAGAAYLAAYSGGPDSASMTVSDAGGVATIEAASSYLLLCSACTNYWSLVVTSGQFSFAVQLTSTSPFVFTAGTSAFAVAGAVDAGSDMSVLVSGADPSEALGFDVTAVSSAPEPGAAGLALVGAGFAALLLSSKWKQPWK